MQNLANGVHFKEAYMEDMNSFIDENLHRMNDFLCELACKDCELQSWTPSDLVVQSSYMFIAKHLHENMDKLTKTLAPENRDRIVLIDKCIKRIIPEDNAFKRRALADLNNQDPDSPSSPSRKRKSTATPNRTSETPNKRRVSIAEKSIEKNFCNETRY